VLRSSEPARSVTELVAVTVKLVKKPVHHALRATAFSPLPAWSLVMAAPYV